MTTSTLGIGTSGPRPTAINQIEINDEHRELWSLLNGLRGLCASGDWLDGSQRELFEALGMLRDRLALHFALEEAGPLDDEMLVDGDLSQEIENLRAEHVDLYQQISDIADEAESLRHRRVTPRAVRRLVRRFDAFDSALITHESREASLLQAAYHDDIGVGD